MSKKSEKTPWADTGWEGSRRAQLRRSLALTLRQRLEALEHLAETSRRFQELRMEGRFRYGPAEPGEDQHVRETAPGYKPTGKAQAPEAPLPAPDETPAPGSGKK
jgi:hypothetical protein